MLKVLTTGRLAAKFYAAVQANELPVQLRLVEHPQQSDFDWADCLACFPVSADFALHRIPWIHSFGAGIDGFVQRKDLHPRLRLSRTTGDLGKKMGEFCLCHLLSFLQNYDAVAKNKETKNWQQRPTKSIRDQTVMILGTGKMAQGVAHTLRCLGAHIIGVNNSGRADEAHFERCMKMAAVPTLAAQVGCIINTLPLHENTQSLIDLPWLSHFRKALLINVGRGPTLVTDDLQPAFAKRYLDYAVLDVFDVEPLPQDSWLWQHPQVFVSPHQAAITDVHDVMKSFTQALHAYELNLQSEVFADLSRGY